MYCPKCGLEDSDNSKLCKSCGENLETGRNYLKATQLLQYISIAFLLMFVVSLIIVSSDIHYGNYSTIIIPILFIVIYSSSILIEKLILPRISGHNKLYCPKCENKDHNENYCIKCGYNLENVFGCFSGNIGVDLYDIELNKKYINLYRHIIERAPDGPGEYHERLAPRTLLLGGIRNMRLSTCKTWFIFPSPCLKFEYFGNTFEFKMNKKTMNKVNKILSTGVYDKLISQDNITDME